jgi:hypothetical protein
MDTSSLIEAWNRNYPLQVFPGVWSGLEALIEAGRLVASEMVREEIEVKSDGLFAWSKAHGNLFVPVDEAQDEEVRAVVRAYRRLVEERKGRNRADPFVIALAKLRGIVCVTEEQFGDETNVRIPFVCARLGVECTDLVGLMTREGWRFS